MRSNGRVGLLAVVLMTAAVLVGGCDNGSDPAADSSGLPDPNTMDRSGPDTSWVLASMPDGEVVTPTDLKERAAGATSVVLAGRIDAGSMDPFQPGEVAFMISQLPEQGHGEDDPDHADNCPFCKRKLANAPKAIVQFRDADGKVIAGDARKVLSVEKGDVVYVTGTASYNPAVDTVMVDATGLFRDPQG